MGEVITIGLDIAKSVFQIHGVDAAGAVVMRKRITRAKLLEFFAALPACLVGIEACPTAHYWSRRLGALGHTVRLLPPSYVKAYLKRNKNDANDAAAICEAVTRPSMRFVPTKSEQQHRIPAAARFSLCLRSNACLGTKPIHAARLRHARQRSNWPSCRPERSCRPAWREQPGR
jgi:transposase